MKKIILSIAVMACFTTATSFAQTANDEFTEYGESFVEGSIITPARVAVLMNNEKELSQYQMSGVIAEVCQAEGCWLRINSTKDNNEKMMVKMKDHAFLLPKDIAGKRVLIQGTISKKEISVKQQQHYLEDAGASKKEIDKIKAPKEEFIMIAEGIKVYE